MMGWRRWYVGILALLLGPSVAQAQGVGDCVALAFVTAGCPQCRAMDQAVEESLEQGWAVRRIDIAKDPYTAQRWRIHSTPTTLLVREGREVDRILGPVSIDELVRRMMSASTRVGNGNGAATSPRSFSLQPVEQRSTAASDPVAPPSAPPAADPTDMASLATVRIQVDEPNTHAFGTGTIIDTHDGEALVITCGHLFRNISPNANITVEIFDRGERAIYPAALLHFEAQEKDIGLITFHAGRQVPCAPIAHRSQRVAEGDHVFSIGCDHGQTPTRRDSRVSKLNRYLGPSNIEVAGMPVQGRSGGGLFNRTGELIGICYAADQEWDEGLYVGTDIIHEQLGKLGLPALPRSTENIASSTPNRRSPGRSSQSITLIVKGNDGSQRELQIQDPSPALLQALEREGYAIVR